MMMFSRGLSRWLVAVLGVGAFSASAPAYNIWAGITLEVHQDVDSLEPAELPNDFHVEGHICTAGGVAPVLADNLNDLFPHLSYTFTKLDPGAPDDCWYAFHADWTLNPGDPGIPHCTVVHLGLLFLVEDENTMIDLVGWWTLDGVRIGDVLGTLSNHGFVPMTGFDVTPTADGQVVRIGNGVFAPIVLPPPIPGPGPWPIPLDLIELDVMATTAAAVGPNWFHELHVGGAQGSWPWVSVTDGAGGDINPGNPVPLPPDSFFDVFLEASVGGGQFAPSSPVTINPGNLFLVRAKRTFTNNTGESEVNGGLWQWHIHEAQGPEACCFADGVCAILTPADCAAHGGFPRGTGTVCDPNPCPQPTEACCYVNGTCLEQIAADCTAGDGDPQGLGTTCDPNPCPQPQPEACCLPDGNCVEVLHDDCLSQDGAPMGVTTCNGVICPQPEDFVFEFSLDIGSDIELSDPFGDGDEAADPGDVYMWHSAPITPPPGRDGLKDDLRMFTLDPWPDPPDPGAPPATRVPIGAGSPDDYASFFDLDGHDQAEISLRTVHGLEGLAVVTPIPQWPSPCIHGPEFLMVSYDDDTASGWPANDVPVTAPSPAGVSSYGSTAGRDEVIGVTLGAVLLPPAPIISLYPVADEANLHGSMMPNPDGAEQNDDDVDSLDIVVNQGACPVWYFSPDHEANYGLDPADVFEVTAGGYVLVVDNVHNLGVPNGTDVDAFEFVWLEHAPESLGLALLFSVDEDDPLTPADESGGMNPNTIYASYLDGTHFAYAGPLSDDIDALTAWQATLEDEQRGACCLPDGACVETTPYDCVNNHAGVFEGDGTVCGGLEACCLGAGDCTMADALCCVSQLSGTPQGPGSQCTALEACCLDTGECVMADPLCCDELGGIPQGAGQVCTEVRACCLNDGTCLMLDPLCCDEMSGVAQGPGEFCTAPEACCLDTGECVMADPLCCDELGGVPQGAGQVCTEVRACCLNDGTCLMLDPLCCDEMDGVAQGPGEFCTAPEACCLDTGECLMADPLCCDELDGTPQGSGTGCVDTTIACCLPDGNCEDLDPLCCDERGGVAAPGDESHCLGDENGNDIDDACEAPPEPPEPLSFPDNRPRNNYVSFGSGTDFGLRAGSGRATNFAYKVELTALELGSCALSGAPCRMDLHECDGDGATCSTDADCTGHGGSESCIASDCGACSSIGNPCITAPVHCSPGETCDLTGETCINDQAGSVGMTWWVGPESEKDDRVHLLVSQVYRKVSDSWPTVIYVADCEVVPRATYRVRKVDVDTGRESAPLDINTIGRPGSNYWGDCVGPLGDYCEGNWRPCTSDADCPYCYDAKEPGSSSMIPCTSDSDCNPETTGEYCGTVCTEQWPPPDSVTNFNDVTAAVFAFQQIPGLTIPDVTWSDVHGNDGGDATVDPPNLVVNFADIAAIVGAFQGWPYPYADPGDCPDVGDWP